MMRMPFSRICASESVDISEICQLDLLNIGATAIATAFLTIGIIHVLIYHKRRCRTLFYLHNARSILCILLVLSSIFEIAESYLAAEITITENISISPLQIAYAWMSMVCVLTSIVFVRIVEIYDKAGYLYLSLLCQIFVFVTKIYKIISLTETLDLNDLRPFLTSATTLCLIFLVFLDSYTIYFESSLTKTIKAALAPDENIGYKHSHSTFLSKITFFWMTPLLWQGYRDPFEIKDLGIMHEKDTCRAQYDQFYFIYRSFETKTPSLWLCYMKTHWKMFAYGGLLKLFGDLTALVGPISITQIVEYIQINLNASSLLLSMTPSPDNAHEYSINLHDSNSNTSSSNTNNIGTSSFLNIATTVHSILDVNSTVIKIGLNHNYYLQSTEQPSLMINENTEIYYPTWSEFIENGWIMGLLVLFATIAQGSFSQASTHIVNMIGIRLRGSLQSLVYRKTLLISSSCFYANANKPFDGLYKNNSMNESTVDNDNCSGGDGADNGWNSNKKSTMCRDGGKEEPDKLTKETTSPIDTGTITNLMSEDALNVMSFFWIAHYVWAIPLKIGFVMYLLYHLLGISAIIGSTVCIVTMIPLQFLIGKKMSSNAKVTALSTDERLRRIGELLMGIKIIKLNAWEKVFKEKIHQTRETELRCLDKDSIYWTLMTFLTHISSVIITFVTLAVFLYIEDTNEKTKFTTGRLFAALALFNQLTVPLFIFPITIPIIISAIVSTHRLEHFLGQPEVQKEFQGIRNMARVMSRSDASLDVFEIDENEGDLDNRLIDSSPLSMTIIPVKMSQSTNEVSFQMESDSNLNNDYFFKEMQTHDSRERYNNFSKRCSNSSIKLKKNNQISMSTQLDRNRPRQKSLSKEIQMDIANDLAVSIRNAIFSWHSDENDRCLRVDKLEIPKGKLTVIVGRSGSGKTSLLAAILREMRIKSGELIWNKYTTIAYVQQTPWLQKAAIRDNIIFGEPYRPRRYEKVLLSCALKEDIELMPNGDQTVIGTNGINLSGGQKQRIAIARALYSSANVVILDDPLSSLDNEVSKWIFDNSIRNMLLKHQRTVILVTQKTYLVHSSDYIISMENNGIRAKGTYRDIENTDCDLILEWNSIIAKENAKDESISTGKTARERWKLFKNISKVGFQKFNTSEENETQTIYHGCKRKPSVYGSRHLTYDIPFPIDECNSDDIEIHRRPSKRERRSHNNSTFGRTLSKSIFRTNSLNVRPPKIERMPVVRNISSPITMQYGNHHRPTTTSDIEMNLRQWDFQKFIDRMSFRRTHNLNRKISRSSRPLSATSSIKSVTISIDNKHTTPVKRLMSTISKHGEEPEDDEICSDYNEEISNRLIYDEERKYGKIPTKIYLLYLKSCGLRVIVVFCLTAIAWQTMKIYTDVWLRDWTDIESVERFNDISYYFGVYGLLSAICIIFSMMTTPSGQYAGSVARKYLHEQLLNSVVRKSIYFFQITPFGRIMNRFSNDMSVIDKKIAATSQRLLQFVLLCLCAILINTIITPWFLLLTIPICGIYYVVQMFYRYSSRELQRIESITSSPILSHFAETIQGVTTIRAYNQESRFMEMLFKRMEANNIAVIILNTSNRWLGIALDYLGGIIVFAAIITALFTAKIYPHATSPSLVALAINYTLLIPIYLNWVVKLLSDMEMYIGAVERVSHYIEANDHHHDVAQPKEKYKPVPISWPKRGDITFENVSLRYENQTENIISNFNLIIPAGQRLGICGRTGSGKSTLAMSLFRVVDIVEGRIIIDDVDISSIHTEEIRTRLSIIPQDVMLFNGTIRENLDPRGHYTDLDLLNSLEMAQLKQSILSLPFGLDTPILDNGNSVFSSGEKQLFCLARAVLRGSVCLVLDEATSSLDGATEMSLLDTASKAFHGRTIITIAHRLTTLLNYDRIIVMENGRILEDGTPQELRLKSGGKFSTMLYSSIQENTYCVPDK